MKRATRFACLALLSTLAAIAGTTPFTAQTVAGSTHEAGEARWSDRLERSAGTGCTQTVESDCVRNVIVVQSESPRPIHCKYRLEHRGGDDKDRRVVEEERIIFPGRRSEAAISYGPAALVPRDFSTKCFIVPAPPLADLGTPKECFGEILGPSPQKFYPPSSQRRQEQGDVILEFGVKRLSAALYDVLLVSSSGSVELDNAALDFSKHLTQRKHCPGKRYRLKVVFTLAGPPLQT